MADEKKVATRTQKPIYAVMVVTDENGNNVPKENIQIIGGFRNADGVLDIIEGGKYPGAVYKKVPLA